MSESLKSEENLKLENSLDDFYKFLEKVSKFHIDSLENKSFEEIKKDLIELCEKKGEILKELNKNFEEKKKIEIELQNEKKLLELLLEKLNVAVFIFNVTNGRFIFEYLNPTHEKLTGFKTSEVKGKTPSEFLPYDIAIQIESNYQKCVELKETIEYEEKLLLKGKETWWYTRLIPLIDNEGKVYKIIGASININEWKRVIDELNEKNTLLEKICEIVPIPLFYKDKNLNFVKVNSAFEKFFNIERKIIFRVKNNEIFPEYLKKLLDEKEKELMEQFLPIEFKTSFCETEDGEKRYILYRMNTIGENRETFTGIVGSIFDMTSQIKYQQFLEELAIKDELTGLYNRRGLKDFVEREWKNSIRYKQPISMLMIDIDNFKAYNDTYGHKMGDECLKKVSEKIKENTLRPADIVARYGGEEFIVILPNTPFEGAMTVAERIKDSVADLKITHPASPFGIITISIGISTSIPEKFEKYEVILEDADKNLYIAKRKGKNRIEGYKILKS
ncbi:MAG: sensor domain-containing diguanylate cyclase [Brevinematia bacterium]